MDFRKSRGTLYIVSAPSGAGKTTLCEKLAREMPSLSYSISHTTRNPRVGEEDGKDYYFIAEDKFKAMIAAGEFAEWAEVHGNLYGTSKAELKRLFDEGKDVILDIDTQGAMQIKKSGMDGVFIFIVPPSREELERRLRGRGTDDDEIIKRRLGNAVGEMRLYREYGYLIVNDRLEQALDELRSVVVAEKNRMEYIDDSKFRDKFGL